MANVVFNIADSDKADHASLREHLEKRNIAYEEKKEGNMRVISIKASAPASSSKNEQERK